MKFVWFILIWVFLYGACKIAEEIVKIFRDEKRFWKGDKDE